MVWVMLILGSMQAFHKDLGDLSSLLTGGYFSFRLRAQQGMKKFKDDGTYYILGMVFGLYGSIPSLEGPPQARVKNQEDKRMPT